MDNRECREQGHASGNVDTFSARSRNFRTNMRDLKDPHARMRQYKEPPGLLDLHLCFSRRKSQQYLVYQGREFGRPTPAACSGREILGSFSSRRPYRQTESAACIIPGRQPGGSLGAEAKRLNSHNVCDNTNQD